MLSSRHIVSTPNIAPTATLENRNYMAGAEHAPRTSKALFLLVFSSHHIVSTPSYFTSLLPRQRICYGGGGTRIEQLQRVVFVCVQLPPYSFQCPQCLLLIHQASFSDAFCSFFAAWKLYGLELQNHGATKKHYFCWCSAPAI